MKFIEQALETGRGAPQPGVMPESRVPGRGDAGLFGIEFFKLVMEKDPKAKARVKVHASTSRLLGRGYLGVLALGGVKVSWWLLKNGIRNPKAAIDRLRGK